jgi:hypothetical protein
VLFEYRIDDGSPPAAALDWIAADQAPPAVVREEITSIASGTGYYAAVSYIVRGVPGDRRILGPVTTGSVSGVPGGGDPGDFVFDGGNAHGVLA